MATLVNAYMLSAEIVGYKNNGCKKKNQLPNRRLFRKLAGTGRARDLPKNEVIFNSIIVQ